MNTTFFKALFITLFLTTFSFSLKAQEDKVSAKWETALIYYGKDVTVVYSNAPPEEIPFTKATNEYGIYQDFLKKLASMMNDGWSVVNITTKTAAYSEKYFLKREIK